MLNRVALLACLAALICAAASEQGCPSPTEIEPCRCYEQASRSLELMCQDIDDTEVVGKVFEKAQRFNFTKFTLRESSMQYIPHQIFEDITIRVIEFEHVSFVTTFDSIPEDPDVTQIYIKRVQVMSGWDWELFSAFKKLEEVYIEDVPLKKLNDDFTNNLTKDLKLFKCEWCEFKKFKGQEFQHLTELESITFNFDSIPNITRSLFPSPSKLKSINFAYNKLTELPDDIFTDMPDLRSLYLGSNQLTVLKEASFQPIIGHLYDLHVDFNPIRCDCRIQWLTKNQQIGVSGKCTEPPEINGQDIGRLSPDDFRC